MTYKELLNRLNRLEGDIQDIVYSDNEIDREEIASDVYYEIEKLKELLNEITSNK